MWAWHKTDPAHIDLKTVTIGDMITLDSPLIKVCTCVDAGFLKKVTGYDKLDKRIAT